MLRPRCGCWVLSQFNLDAIVTATGAPAFTADLVDGDHFQGTDSTPAAVAGYPHITVPGGNSFGLPTCPTGRLLSEEY